MGIGADAVQNLRGFILMENTLLLFPYIEMFLSYRKKKRNIFFFYDVAFFEENTFLFVFDDLCNVMT